MKNFTFSTAEGSGIKQSTELPESINHSIDSETKAVLTLEEAAKYMGLSKSYLYKLTAMRQVPHYKPRGKMCYFNRAELEQWLQSNRVCTMEELSDKANSYCRKGGAV